MIHIHYWQKNQEDGIGGGPGNGGGGDYRGPGWDENGDGANGHYYDYFSGTYRSSASGNPEVSWNNVYYNLIATGNTYSTLDMGRHDRVYENAYRPNPDGKIRLFVTYTDCVIVSGSYFDNNPASGRVDDISQAGLNFIAGYEGFSATTYNDVAELPTIGYGHLIKPGESFGTLSRNAALQLLRKDASFAVNAVNKYVTVSLSQNQFDALTSLTFNIGAGAFSKSTVLSDVNSGNTLSIDKSFMMWNKARIDGVLTPVQGLTNRRQAESNLFLNGNY